MSTEEKVNTDKEIWREKDGDFYSPSIHVTEQGEISIHVGGCVTVLTVQEWYGLYGQLRLQRKEISVSYRKGFNAGLRSYAWWKSGVQYIGTCGRKLSEALMKEEE